MPRVLTDDRCEEIKHEVLYMFQETETHTYPIDPFTIAERLYYRVRSYSDYPDGGFLKAFFIDPDAFSLMENDAESGMPFPVIYYNERANKERMRFTLLHEIGHIYLDHFSHKNPTESEMFIEEKEADFFAKYAIAPPPLVCINQCHSPEELQELFDTSGECSIYSFNYYRKWQQYGEPFYLDYEIDMINQFEIA